MKVFKSPIKLVVISSILNLAGNVGLWVAAVVYRLLHAEEAQVDDSRIAMVMEVCWNAGRLLIAFNAFALLVALFWAVRSRRWAWIIASPIIIAALAYEDFLVGTFYAMAFMTP